MKAQRAAQAAEAAVIRDPPILYTQEDCQGFIEATVRRAGGSIKDYAGSNDMYRNACTQVRPLNDAVLEPGCLLFIVEHDGNEPDQYKADGLGNASHVGMYTGGIYEVVHSSATKGGVAASTLKNGWTHAGRLKGLEYVGAEAIGHEDDIVPQIAYINLPADENVFHRISPNKSSAWWGRINGQEQVELVGVENGWARVRYGGHDGYVASQYVSWDKQPEQPDIVPDIVPDVDRQALLNELKGIFDRANAIVKLL